MATDTVTVELKARDGASQTFATVGRNAATMGREVDRAGQDAASGLDRVSRAADKLDEIGTAIGIVVGGMALLGANAREHEQSVRALELAYGDSADEIIAFSEAIQDSTNFSNDAAREALLTASTLTRAYGLTAEQAQEVVAVSADLAQVYGIDLVDATERVAGAIRGEGEAAELLGLNMSDAAVAAAAAAAGLTGWNTTMTEGEKAAFRYNLLLEQTAQFHGAAGEAAHGAAGAGAAFRDWLDDTAEAAGAALGPAGEFLAVTGNLALAAPAAGYALGKLAQGAKVVAESQRAAALASGAMSLTLGPLGFIAAGVAAVGILGELTNWFGLTGDASADTDAAIQGLTDSVYALNAAGADASLVIAAQGIIEEWTGVHATLGETEERLLRIQEIGSQLDVRLNPEAANFTAEQVAALERERRTLQELVDSNLIATVDQQLSDLIGHLDDANVDTTKLLSDINARIDQFKAGEITLGELNFFLQDMLTHFNEWYVVLPQATDALGRNVEQVKLAAEAYQDLDAAWSQQELTLTALDLAYQANTDAMAEAEQAAQDLDAAWSSQELTLNATELAARAAADATLAAAAAAQELDAAWSSQELTLTATELELQATADAAERAAQSYEELDSAWSSQPMLDPAQMEQQAAAMNSIEYAAAAAADGLFTLAEAQGFLTRQQTEFSAALGYYNEQLGYIDQALAIIQEKQANGIALTERETRILNESAGAQAYYGDQVEDSTYDLAENSIALADNETKAQTLGGAMGAVAEAVDGLTASVDVLIETLGGIPPSKNIDVYANTAPAIAALNGLVGYQGDAYINVYARNVGPIAGPGMGGYQHGGLIPSESDFATAQHGRMTLVGEAGPEFVSLPGGSNVHPAGLSRSLARGMGGSRRGVVIYGNPTFQMRTPDVERETVRQWRGHR